MATYRVIKGSESITPIYPAGKDYFTAEEDVHVLVKYQVERSSGVSGPEGWWSQDAYYADGTFIKNFSHGWGKIDAPFQTLGQVNRDINLGKLSAGTQVISMRVIAGG